MGYNCEEVVENDEDDPDFEINKELEDDRDRNAFEQKLIYSSDDEDNSDCDRDIMRYDDGFSDELDDASDCDSQSSMYKLTSAKVPFVCLNIMILMEYTEGVTLRDIIDNQPSYLTRDMIFHLFT